MNFIQKLSWKVIIAMVAVGLIGYIITSGDNMPDLIEVPFGLLVVFSGLVAALKWIGNK